MARLVISKAKIASLTVDYPVCFATMHNDAMVSFFDISTDCRNL